MNMWLQGGDNQPLKRNTKAKKRKMALLFLFTEVKNADEAYSEDG
jgi:hypothetical protein